MAGGRAVIRRLWLYALAVSVSAALLVGGLSWAGTLEGLELWSLDRLFWSRGPREPDPRLLLVLVDQQALEQVDRPLIFWAPEFARAARILRAAGARVVGLDFVLAPGMGGLPPDDPVAARLAEGAQELAGEILAGGVVVIEYLEVDGAPKRSHEVIHFSAEARQAVGAANVFSDLDGVVRRVPLFFSGPDTRTRALAGVLAEQAEGRPLELREAAAFLGDIPIPTDPPGEAMLINYPGEPGTIPSLSLAQVEDQVRQGRRFDGMVCLIAPGTRDLQDLHPTPMGAGMLGGEVQLAALDTLLSRRFLRRAPASSTQLAVAGMCLLMGALAFAWHPVRSLTALASAAGLYFLASWLSFVRGGLWLSLAAPILGGALAWTAGYALRFLTVERERREVQGIFGRYVAPQVMAELLRHPESLALGGTRRRMTFLFSDINDFSPLCARSTPEQVITMLNRYFEEMVGLVFAHGGTVKQFVGDEIMALYGAPEPQPDHAARAVRTAVEMAERLEEMERRSNGEPGFYAVKIGIHTGDAVVGSIGTMERSEYSAVGDDVNIAARIESRAKQLGATLLVSEATRLEAEPLLPEFEWIPRGEQDLKGIGRPIPVYEVRRRGRVEEESNR